MRFEKRCLVVALSSFSTYSESRAQIIDRVGGTWHLVATDIPAAQSTRGVQIAPMPDLVIAVRRERHVLSISSTDPRTPTLRFALPFPVGSKRNAEAPPGILGTAEVKHDSMVIRLEGRNAKAAVSVQILVLRGPDTLDVETTHVSGNAHALRHRYRYLRVTARH